MHPSVRASIPGSSSVPICFFFTASRTSIWCEKRRQLTSGHSKATGGAGLHPHLISLRPQPSGHTKRQRKIIPFTQFSESKSISLLVHRRDEYMHTATVGWQSWGKGVDIWALIKVRIKIAMPNGMVTGARFSHLDGQGIWLAVEKSDRSFRDRRKKKESKIRCHLTVSRNSLPLCRSCLLSLPQS